MKKGHSYVSILSDVASGIVIEVVEGRTKESVDTLCESLSVEQRKDVKTICTDMWDAYIYGVNNYFTKAKHFQGNYHLASFLNEDINKERRREIKTYHELKKTKYLWLKDQMSYTDKQQIQFDAISEANYDVSRAWRVKENFRDIHFEQDRLDTLSLYVFWRMDAKRVNIPEVNQVIEMFDRHQSGIVNAIQTGATNARAERLNGSIQELKTIGRGYRTFANFRTAILFFHGNLKLFPHKIQ